MGDVFAGRYELVDPLGEGGAGVVWRAWDRKHHRYCAAKVLRQTDASSLLRFMREQSMRLDHPHVLAPTGWAGEDDKVLFTMPIVRGGSVSTLLSDFGPLPSRLVAVLLDQLLTALETIHAEGIVHRDVKPANLLLDATGQHIPHLWLGDFGIAAGDDAPRLTQGPFAMGTPGYAAPECLQRGWQPDARADLYAAGMCAVEMLTGMAPETETEARLVVESAPREDAVPEELVDLIAQLGDRDLRTRIRTAADAREELRASGLLEFAEPAEILGDVEVFDHLPELPEGWDDSGPTRPSPAEKTTAAAVPTAASPSPPPSASSPGIVTGPQQASAAESWSQAPGNGETQPRDVPTLDVQTQAMVPPAAPTSALPYEQAMPVPPLGVHDPHTQATPVRSAPSPQFTPPGIPQYQPSAPYPSYGAPQYPGHSVSGAPTSTRSSKTVGLWVSLLLLGAGLLTLAFTLWLALG
ncbi:serine/threonine-protein kinase [Nesterenkonia flava]|uniref:non-specific serine/threonine protein kinase n=1 Tax=Nesterenkonia flava TaxID=469799 RepID=A0ABU1FQU5_9MICC|nr:protein kinase [Nesterenkonia flava]MDR5710732.1 protein kinase [Nesterenkonia flava]